MSTAQVITLPVYNTEGKEVDSIKLDSKVFDGIVNNGAIWQAVTAFRSNQRRGLASTKTRGEVSGGGRKPWRQKGTGRARVGSTRSPLWRHGGVIFGPHPRSFYNRLPEKIKNLALKSCLNAKLKENNIIVLEELKLAQPKTKEATKIFSNLKITNSQNVDKENLLLLLLDKQEDSLSRALGNINFLSVGLANNTNAYEVLSNQKVVITKKGLTDLTNRLKK
ncbi:MAG: 50S ribosomal protein L4 [Omnitrophica WOR_2 bacterium RBG_13_44_8b]|nr:MAG: 50S ribosomal protein L4 [Omnitrophica WOR_2 bacterium RBG_13_44_8b]